MGTIVDKKKPNLIEIMHAQCHFNTFAMLLVCEVKCSSLSPLQKKQRGLTLAVTECKGHQKIKSLQPHAPHQLIRLFPSFLFRDRKWILHKSKGVWPARLVYDRPHPL